MQYWLFQFHVLKLWDMHLIHLCQQPNKMEANSFFVCELLKHIDKLDLAYKHSLEMWTDDSVGVYCMWVEV